MRKLGGQMVMVCGFAVIGLLAIPTGLGAGLIYLVYRAMDRLLTWLDQG